MTREEAIRFAEHAVNMTETLKIIPEVKEFYRMAAAALRPVNREPLEKFKEFFDDLYGKGLEVYGWHMNGEAKSFDDFYEDACEYAGL